MTNPATPQRTSSKPGKTSGDERGLALDLIVVLAGVSFVVVAALVGWELLARGVGLFMWFPPLIAAWDPQLGPASAFAVLIAGAVVCCGPSLASRLDWRVLLPGAWLVSAAWTTSLAMISGFRRGIAERLTSSKEYLNDVARVTDIPRMLREFSANIVNGQPEPWSMHVGAHPPGALLVFVWLERIGLGGGAAAGLFCIAVGASACVAVAVTMRALGAERVARTALPFGVLFPGAVWVGVSADGMFAGVLAWGVALCAVAAAGRGWRHDLGAVAGGLLLGYALYLSYGLVLGGLVALAVFALTRNWRALSFSVLGVGAVIAAFTLAGFWWLNGFESLQVVYAKSVARTRPDWYFAWANLAALCLPLGPAVLAGIRRVVVHPGRVPALTALVGAALLAVLVADLTGKSQGEVERIWLPFAIWMTLSCAMLPRLRLRGWLAAQAVLTLLVEHLLFTPW